MNLNRNSYLSLIHNDVEKRLTTLRAPATNNRPPHGKGAAVCRQRSMVTCLALTLQGDFTRGALRHVGRVWHVYQHSLRVYTVIEL